MQPQALKVSIVGLGWRLVDDAAQLLPTRSASEVAVSSVPKNRKPDV